MRQRAYISWTDFSDFLRGQCERLAAGSWALCSPTPQTYVVGVFAWCSITLPTVTEYPWPNTETRRRCRTLLTTGFKEAGSGFGDINSASIVAVLVFRTVVESIV